MTSYLGSKRWKPATLQDLITLQRGFDITKAEQKEGEIPVISSSGVGSWHNEAMVEGPGVIIGRKGSLGTVHYSEGAYWPHDTTLWSKSLHGNNPRFVYYALKLFGLERFNVGGANPTLNRNHIHGLPIFLADRTTQDNIAAILTSYDDLIENTRRRIWLLEEAARLLYREWFVYFRFPGRDHVKITNGLPESWQRIKLGSVLTLQRGFDLPVASRTTGDIPVYGSTGVVGTHATPKVISPTLITGRSGSLGTVCFVDDPCWPLNTSLWVKEFKAVSPYFGYFLLQKMNLAQFNGGASVPTLDRNVVHAADVVVPTGLLASLFDDQVSILFMQKKVLERQNEKLAEARDLLLPRLMNGEIAV